MATDIINPGQVSIYPGVHERSWNENDLAKEIQKPGAQLYTPPLHIQQFTDHYRIEMAIPGFQKDDFFIHSNGRLLTISGICNKHENATATSDRSAETSYECITRNVLLPVDADTDFATARYDNGILFICLFSANQPVENGSSEIIVY